MSVDFETDLLVIGAGAVGLAITRAAALKGHDVLLIEANEQIGQETSARNSEVIHAGIYYPKGSLKAQLCVKGALAMYDFCAARGVTTQNYGKLIVATDQEQVAKLEALKTKGDDNEVPDLEMVSGKALEEKEPYLKAEAALYSPLTGVVDSQSYMLALLGDAENAGATVALQSRFIKASREGGRYVVQISSMGEETTIGARQIINSAGHGAQEVSQHIEGVRRDSIPPRYMAKGQYFTTSKKPPFSHLIYPVPSDGGLGIHLTLDTGGSARFGPDIIWMNGDEAMDYSVNPADRKKFHQLISEYWPDLAEDDLVPAWAGIRPKIVPDGSQFQDFTIHGAETHGADGVITLFGIDSPGLTSSLALGEYVMALETLDL